MASAAPSISSASTPTAGASTGAGAGAGVGAKAAAAASMTTTAIIVGPVIGFVSDTTARVLLEVEEAGVVLCHLTSDTADDGTTAPAHAVCMSMNAGVPAVFRFAGLKPDTGYRVWFTGVSNGEEACRKGSFTTLRAVVDTMRIMAVACDKDKKKNRGPVNMWERLWDNHIGPTAEDPIDMLIHHGDQVYADHAFAAAKKIFKDRTDKRTRDEKIAAACAEYQIIYRRVWNRPETRRVLANIPNVTLWDDHEVRNDWGTFPEDHDHKSVAFAIGLGARQAYWWYQRQLWDDLPGTPPPQDDTEVNAEVVNGTATPSNATAAASKAAPSLSIVTSSSTAGAGAGAGVGTAAGDDDTDDTRGADITAPTQVVPATPGAMSPAHFTRHLRLVSTSRVEVSLAAQSPAHKDATIQHEGYTLVMPGGRVAILMVDIRGSRSFYHEDGAQHYFGSKQWTFIKDSLASDGTLSNVRTLITVSTGAVILLGSSCSNCCKCLSKDKVGLGLYPDEQREFLDTLTAWYQRPLAGATGSKAQRQLLIIGGDLHFSVSTQLSRNGTPMFKQVISSAISNKPPYWFQYYLFKCLMHCCTNLAGGWSFSHNNFFPAQNMCFLECQAQDGMAPSITDTVLRSREVCCDYRGCCYK